MKLTRTTLAIGLYAGAVVVASAPAGAQTRVESPHGSLSLPCAQCHTATAWKPTRVSGDFRHATTRFPLEGAHARTECTACHRSLQFKNVSRTCNSCHSDVHRGELGADCARCHSPRSFVDRAAMVRTHQTSRFPLTGAHAVVDCVSCHVPAAQGQLQFVNRSTECESCHRTEARMAKTPDHAASGFSRQCESCHAPTVWNRARFDHAATSFPLSGAHARVTCQGCHGDGVYAGKNAACVSCHQADYNSTSNPPHTGAGFPATCASCHTTVTWTGAKFDHDGPYFPIYSGKHLGRWSSCSTCHTNAANYAQFTCLSCHQQVETDGHHRAISGYSYQSQACYSCHRNGRVP